MDRFYRSVIALAASAVPVLSCAPSHAATEAVVYSFKGGKGDGAQPGGGLVNLGGTLYGTTSAGGAKGLGTVYALTPAGTEKVLFSFSSVDSFAPNSTLLAAGGALYGTTGNSVFKITKAGEQTVLHTFSGGSDGILAMGGLIAMGGRFYGTTLAGGVSGDGTVYEITRKGREKVLYSFAGGNDGAQPFAALAAFGGVLYGTTATGGGSANCVGIPGCGTVFKITAAGAESVLYAFQSQSSGFEPECALTPAGGKLYGTAFGVFSVTTAGKEAQVYTFGGQPNDGSGPVGSLLNVKGLLYGTTVYGGAYGGGTLYSVTKSGTETILHSFGNGTDAINPESTLLNVNGTIYGTTSKGGAHGQGVVFSVTP